MEEQDIGLPGPRTDDLCGDAKSAAPEHSAGPWFLNPDESHPWFVEGLDSFGLRATIVEVGYRPNATLIAAAPELLEAAQGVSKLFSDIRVRADSATFNAMKAALDALDAAVAKAEGRA